MDRINICFPADGIAHLVVKAFNKMLYVEHHKLKK